MSIDFRPWAGFAAAADSSVRQLNRSVPGMDLWLVTRMVDDRQIVVASAGAWAQLAEQGAAFSWQASFCAQMINGGPSVAPRVQDVPVYRSVAIGPLAKVRAYLGVPLMRGDGDVYGSLCAFAGSTRPESLAERLPSVTLVGRLLSTILSGENTALDRSQEAAQAYALAQRDATTGLRNRRGWQEQLTLEEDRCSLYGTRASVLSVVLDDLAAVQRDLGHEAGQEMLRRFAALLIDVVPRSDVVSSVDRDELAVLSVETDLLAARELAARVLHELQARNLSGSLGVASRLQDETLARTWARAQDQARARSRKKAQKRSASAGAARQSAQR